MTGGVVASAWSSQTPQRPLMVVIKDFVTEVWVDMNSYPTGTTSCSPVELVTFADAINLELPPENC